MADITLNQITSTIKISKQKRLKTLIQINLCKLMTYLLIWSKQNKKI